MAGKPAMVILKDGEGEVTEKKSRFIANLYKIQSEEEAHGRIAGLKKRYWDARHHCYAFLLGEGNAITRCCDDGEPSGTAGKPILEVLLGAGLGRCLLVVTRYFGGTLLGTGGLVRAYQKAAAAAIENAVITECLRGICLTVETDYSGLGKIQHMAAQEKIPILSAAYVAGVEIVLGAEEGREKEIVKKIQEATAGRAGIAGRERCLLGRDIRTGELFLMKEAELP